MHDVARSADPSLPEKRTESGLMRIALPAEARALPERQPAASPPHSRPGLGESHTLQVSASGDTVTLRAAFPLRQEGSAALLRVVTSGGARLSRVQQHEEVSADLTFSRLVVDTTDMPGGAAALCESLEALAPSLGARSGLRRAPARKRVALFVSKFDHCLHDLLLRRQRGELDCEVPLVVSNHEDLRRTAESYGVEFRHSPKSAARKAAAESEELALLADHGIDLVVMARYMQVLSPRFVREWTHRVINIHHSLLPAFMGAKPYHRALQRGVKLVGATAHYATGDLDEGPIIEQDVARCDHQDSLEDLLRKGRDLERTVLARAVRWHLEDRILVSGNRTVVFR